MMKLDEAILVVTALAAAAAADPLSPDFDTSGQLTAGALDGGWKLPDLEVVGLFRDDKHYRAAYCNKGLSNGGGFHLRFWRHDAVVVGGFQAGVGTAQPSPDLPPGACAITEGVDCGLLGDPGCDGSSHVNVKVDIDGVVSERDETNNVFGQHFSRADPPDEPRCDPTGGYDGDQLVNKAMFPGSIGNGPDGMSCTIMTRDYDDCPACACPLYVKHSFWDSRTNKITYVGLDGGTGCARSMKEAYELLLEYAERGVCGCGGAIEAGPAGVRADEAPESGVRQITTASAEPTASKDTTARPFKFTKQSPASDLDDFQSRFDPVGGCCVCGSPPAGKCRKCPPPNELVAGESCCDHVCPVLTAPESRPKSPGEQKRTEADSTASRMKAFGTDTTADGSTSETGANASGASGGRNVNAWMLVAILLIVALLAVLTLLAFVVSKQRKSNQAALELECGFASHGSNTFERRKLAELTRAHGGQAEDPYAETALSSSAATYEYQQPALPGTDPSAKLYGAASSGVIPTPSHFSFEGAETGDGAVVHAGSSHDYAAIDYAAVGVAEAHNHGIPSP